MNSFEVSVITPVYNAEKYIETAVNSALQHNCVKEVILVEDNSPDNALAVCKALEKKHDRVKVYQHPNGENRGAGASRNLGIEKASCDYIAFLDADDFFLENRFEKEKELINTHKDIDGVYNAIGVHYYSEKAKENFNIHLFTSKTGEKLTTVTKKLKPEYLFDYLIQYRTKDAGYFHIDGFTVKRKKLLKYNIKFNENLRLHQDTFFIILCSYYLKLIPGSLDYPVSNRGVHEENRITSNNANKRKSINNRLKLYNELLEWAKESNLKTHYLNHFYRVQLLYKLKLLDSKEKQLRHKEERKKHPFLNNLFIPENLDLYIESIPGSKKLIVLQKMILSKWYNL